MLDLRALDVVLQRDIASRVGGCRRPFLTGCDAVRLNAALRPLRPSYGENLGIRAPLAVTLLRIDDPLSQERAISELDLDVLSDVGSIHRVYDRRLRYVALRAGNHFPLKTIDVAVNLLRGRPYELWYAVRDSGLEGDVDERIIRMLSTEGAMEVLRTQGAEAKFGISGRDCAGLCELLAEDDVLRFMSLHPCALLDNDWLRDHLSKDTLGAALYLKSLRGENVPDPDWLEDAFRDHSSTLCEYLGTERLSIMEPDWLARNVENKRQLCTAMSGRFDTVTPQWIFANVEGRVVQALAEGGHLEGVTLEWIVEHLPRSHCVAALVESKLVATASKEWIMEHAPKNQWARAFMLGDVAEKESAEWLVEHLLPENRYAVLLAGRKSELRDRDFVYEHLPRAHALRALILHGGVLSCTREWLKDRFQGETLAEALAHAGHAVVDDFDTLDDLQSMYGQSLFQVLADENRIEDHPFIVLAARLPPGDVYESLEYYEDVTADELGQALKGDLLADALIDFEMEDEVDMAWLLDHGVNGMALFRVLSRGQGLADMDPDTLRDLFQGDALASALLHTGEHGNMTDEEMMAAFEGHPSCLLELLIVTRRARTCCPDAFVRHVSPEEHPEVTAAMARETAAWSTMDPDRFPLYGITRPIAVGKRSGSR